MAVSFLCHDVSDLCIGKPAVSSLPLSATTVGDALSALRRSASAGDRQFILVVDRSSPEKKPVAAGKVCLGDVFCFLCSDERNLADLSSALSSSVSVLLRKGRLRHLEPHSSVLEALDEILDGSALDLVIPHRHRGSSGKKHVSNLCSVTQEDLVRHFLSSISLFSPIAALSISSLGLIQSKFPSVRPQSAAIPAVSLLRRNTTPVAVVTDSGHLSGEISFSLLSSCDESALATVDIASFTADELVAYLECAGRRPARPAPETVVCRPGSSLVAVILQALAHRVDHVWVVDDVADCKLVGLVTFLDVLRVFREQILIHCAVEEEIGE